MFKRLGRHNILCVSTLIQFNEKIFPWYVCGIYFQYIHIHSQLNYKSHSNVKIGDIMHLCVYTGACKHTHQHGFYTWKIIL